MRKTILAVLALAMTTSVFAQQQIRAPRPSPQASLTQTIGITDMTIKYSRPGVKGRQVWGSLVPYDKVWRAGANEATTISFSDDVWIGGQKLAKGTYSFHATPGQTQWTLHFNSVADQWGSYSYDAAKDVVTVKVTPQRAEFREWMGFEVSDMTTDTATVQLRWENVAVPFTVDTKATERTMTQFRNAMNPDWRTPYMAANFAFENKGAATDAEMSQWIEQSLKANQNIANLYLRARMAERAGNKADAVRYGEMAIAAATPQQGDFAAEVRRNVDLWKK
ncbi:MAG TPA: DUF2911 domain-containing protein [Thermoanaerobaculia bacterium]|nr:DUF2911 domain-containing protein [Thermoanaerobaculia bacterium]